MTAKQQLLDALAALPGLEARPSPVAGGTALFFQGKEFAHFHHDHEIDLRLTRPLIRSLGLQHPPDSKLHRDRSASSPWIELRFSTDADIRRVVDLVQLAMAQLSPATSRPPAGAPQPR